MKMFGEFIKTVLILAIVTGASFASGTVYNFDDQDNDTMETIAGIGFTSPIKLSFSREALNVISDPRFDPSLGKDSETRRTKALLLGTVGMVTSKRIQEMNNCFAVNDNPIEVDIGSIGYNASMYPTALQLENANSLFYRVVNFPSRRGTPSTLTNPFVATYYNPDGTQLHSHEITEPEKYMIFLKDCFTTDQCTVIQPALGKISIQYKEAASFTETPAAVVGGASAGAGGITTPVTPSHLVSSTDSSLIFEIRYRLPGGCAGPMIRMYPTQSPEIAIRDLLSKGFRISDSKPGKIDLVRDSAAVATESASSRVAVEDLSVSGKGVGSSGKK